MYGHIATATGWTFADIDQLTLWDVEELFGYWKDYPPTHILMNASFARAGSRADKSHAAKQSDRLGEIKRAVLAVGGEAKRILPDLYKR